MFYLLLLACGASTVVEEVTSKTAFESGDIATCRSTDDALACYRAAVQNPDYPALHLLLSPACVARIEDSCRRYHAWARQHGTREEMESSALFGCDGGDEVMCEQMLIIADEPESAKSRDFLIEFVRKARAAKGAE